MANAQLIVRTLEQEFEPGTAGGHWAFDVIPVDSGPWVSIRQLEPIAVVALSAGDYTAQAYRLDTEGTPIGNTVHTSFEVVGAGSVTLGAK